MHGLQEIIYANEKAYQQAKTQSLKWRNQSAHQTLAKLAGIRSGKTPTSTK